jgi:hypothetical protein
MPVSRPCARPSTNPHLRLDLSKVRQTGCCRLQRLLDLLQQAHKDRREIELLGRDHLAALLDSLVVPGRTEDQACWLLKLEVLSVVWAVGGFRGSGGQLCSDLRDFATFLGAQRVMPKPGRRHWCWPPIS